MKTTLKTTTALITSIAILSACAQHSSEIPAQYTSPMQYSSYDCRQLEMEMQKVSGRVTELGAQNDKVATDDSVAMGVGLILFWPALFFLDKNTAQAAEYGRLKGEFDALEDAAIQKGCGFHIERPKVAPPAEANKPAAEDYPTSGKKR